jgi:hypothetical protein
MPEPIGNPNKSPFKPHNSNKAYTHRSDNRYDYIDDNIQSINEKTDVISQYIKESSNKSLQISTLHKKLNDMQFIIKN